MYSCALIIIDSEYNVKSTYDNTCRIDQFPQAHEFELPITSHIKGESPDNLLVRLSRGILKSILPGKPRQ